VFAAEKLVIEASAAPIQLHRRCFKVRVRRAHVYTNKLERTHAHAQCTYCKKLLKLGAFSSVDGVFYCEPHFVQV
jgi:hypothetical protein